MRNSFEPINLKYASKHLDWVVSNFKERSQKEIKKPKKSLFGSFIELLKRIF